MRTFGFSAEYSFGFCDILVPANMSAQFFLIDRCEQQSE